MIKFYLHNITRILKTLIYVRKYELIVRITLIIVDKRFKREEFSLLNSKFKLKYYFTSKATEALSTIFSQSSFPLSLL
jgi:hypothetical protein